MSRPRSVITLLLLALLCASPACQTKRSHQGPASLASGKLAGQYRAQVGNPGGNGSYSADVTIATTGAYYSLTWNIGKERSYHGVGVELPGLLAVGWGLTDYYVFSYELAGTRLTGNWASSKSQGKLGSEVLEGPATLNGRFQITDGYDPVTGKSYDGSVSIAQNGAIYRIQRATSDGRTLGGVAIKKGSRLLVGAGPNAGAGVMVYTLTERGLSGQWAQPTSNLLGTEYLSRR